MAIRTVDECFVQIRNGVNIKQGVHDGGFPITRIETISNDHFNRERMGYAGITDIGKYESYILQDGDLLMSHINSLQYLGRTVEYKKNGNETIIHGMNLLGLRANKDIINPTFAQYAFRSFAFHEQLSRVIKKSVNQASFTVSDLKKIKLNVPELSTQQIIVDILEKAKKLKKQREQQLQVLDVLIKARFVELFGDPLNNKKGWSTLTLSEVCSSILGGGTPSKSQPEYFTGTIPWVTPKDMKSAVIRDSIDHITENAIANSTTNLVPANSVLMVIRSGILKHSLPVAINCVPVTINQDMKAFVPGKLILAEYLMYYFKTIESDVLAGVRGVTADNIDFKTFQQRPIVVPPMDLQNAFAVFVSQIDKSKIIVQKALDEALLLYDNLMQQYFG